MRQKHLEWRKHEQFWLKLQCWSEKVGCVQGYKHSLSILRPWTQHINNVNMSDLWCKWLNNIWRERERDRERERVRGERERERERDGGERERDEREREREERRERRVERERETESDGVRREREREKRRHSNNSIHNRLPTFESASKKCTLEVRIIFF